MDGQWMDVSTERADCALAGDLSAIKYRVDECRGAGRRSGSNDCTPFPSCTIGLHIERRWCTASAALRWHQFIRADKRKPVAAFLAGDRY